jgi:hypothetical protein
MEILRFRFAIQICLSNNNTELAKFLKEPGAHCELDHQDIDDLTLKFQSELLKKIQHYEFF